VVSDVKLRAGMNVKFDVAIPEFVADRNAWRSVFAPPYTTFDKLTAPFSFKLPLVPAVSILTNSRFAVSWTPFSSVILKTPVPVTGAS
jgi:hypothetical protein